MSDFTRAADSVIDQDDWARMAAHAKMSPQDLKNKILPVLEGMATPGLAAAQVTPTAFQLPATTKAAQCETQRFEISLFRIVGISGTATLCGTGAHDWSLELKFCLVLAGAEVWCTSYKFDPHNLGVCFNIDIALLNGQICFKLLVDATKICLNLNGKLCVWALGWHCDQFDVTPFCLPIP